MRISRFVLLFLFVACGFIFSNVSFAEIVKPIHPIFDDTLNWQPYYDRKIPLFIYLVDDEGNILPDQKPTYSPVTQEYYKTSDKNWFHGAHTIFGKTIIYDYWIENAEQTILNYWVKVPGDGNWIIKELNPFSKFYLVSYKHNEEIAIHLLDGLGDGEKIIASFLFSLFPKT